MMRKKVRDLGYYELLNLPPDASDADIEKSFLTLTSIYGAGSIAPYGALDEEEKNWMLKRIQEAYNTLIAPVDRETYLDDLKRSWGNGKKNETKEVNSNNADFIVTQEAVSSVNNSNGDQKHDHPADTGETATPIHPSPSRITGAHLRNIRVSNGATLDEISNITKVKKFYLEAIENDDFSVFPAPIFMKGFLKSYAKVLGLNPEEISRNYSLDSQ